MHFDYDCIVMGGGPAGTTVASLVAEAGYRTLLVEREKFPRFHVGESLMPETYGTFRRLGVLGRMKKSSFVRKVSVQFVSQSGQAASPFDFRRHDPHERSQTWQVERSRFDAMLMENAAEKGADCHDATRVDKVLFDDGRATGVSIRSAAGSTHGVSSRVVVDATGQSAHLATSLGLKQIDPHLKKAAVWTYYQHARREPGEHGGATVIFHAPSKRAWFWFIPLSDDVTSIGVVSDNDYLLPARAKPGDVFTRQLGQCPALTDRLTDASRIGAVHVAREFSYHTSRSAGDGWVAVGDAWGFIDPIYSSGVYFAMKSGELAADGIIDGLCRGDTSESQLGKWDPGFAAGTQWIRKLVHAFYAPHFSFGRFIEQHPEHRGRLTDLLIGRVFHSDVGRMFDDMDPWLHSQHTRVARP